MIASVGTQIHGHPVMPDISGFRTGGKVDGLESKGSSNLSINPVILAPRTLEIKRNGSESGVASSQGGEATGAVRLRPCGKRIRFRDSLSVYFLPDLVNRLKRLPPVLFVNGLCRTTVLYKSNISYLYLICHRL